MMRARQALLLALLVVVVGTARAQLTDRQKRQILELHNDARASVSPRASDMVQLSWDDELAEKAQGWADTCIDRHNSVRSSKRWRWIGENMAYSTAPDLRWMVEGWEGEKKIYSYGDNSCSPIPGDPMMSSCGHYTQMVWANTEFVGCGFQGNCPGRFPNRLVCNYGQAGNWIGQKPYKSGRKCSSCPGGYSRCKKRLCVSG